MRVKKAPDKVRHIKETTQERLDKRAALGAMLTLGKRKKAATARGVSRSQAVKNVKAAEALVESAAFGDFSPREWVGLFCWIHEAIYSVDCVEEVRREWNTAAAAVSKMLRGEFDSDGAEFYQYVIWVAKREEEREAWRRRNQKPGTRLDWRSLFLRHKSLTDYRIDKARREGVM